jgi:hypothetical protein
MRMHEPSAALQPTGATGWGPRAAHEEKRNGEATATSNNHTNDPIAVFMLPCVRGKSDAWKRDLEGHDAPRRKVSIRSRGARGTSGREGREGGGHPPRKRQGRTVEPRSPPHLGEHRSGTGGMKPSAPALRTACACAVARMRSAQRMPAARVRALLARPRSAPPSLPV